VYAFVYALLIQVLELRTPKCDNSRTDGAPSGGRTHTGRILSPPRETPGFQNLEDLSVAQAQVLGILRDMYAFCSPAGATGVSSSGVSYTCKTSPTDTRNRWRQ